MYDGSIPHDRILRAFELHVPGSYVRDYRDNGGYICVCRGYRNIPWRDQTTTANVYRQVPSETLVNLPRGNVTSASLYSGTRLMRPGWISEFRRASRHLTYTQMRRITKELGRGEVFYGVV